MCSDWRVSIRKACVALRFDRSSYHYKSRRTDPAALKKRIKEICETRVRYGYRRVHFVLQREGWPVNAKKTYRIYKELGLQLVLSQSFRSLLDWLARGRSGLLSFKVGTQP